MKIFALLLLMVMSSAGIASLKIYLERYLQSQRAAEAIYCVLTVTVGLSLIFLFHN